MNEPALILTAAPLGYCEIIMWSSEKTSARRLAFCSSETLVWRIPWTSKSVSFAFSRSIWLDSAISFVSSFRISFPGRVRTRVPSRSGSKISDAAPSAPYTERLRPPAQSPWIIARELAINFMNTSLQLVNNLHARKSTLGIKRDRIEQRFTLVGQCGTGEAIPYRFKGCSHFPPNRFHFSNFLEFSKARITKILARETRKSGFKIIQDL